MSTYWQEQHLEQLNQAQSFEAIGKIACDVLENMPENVHIVSGPISSGGLGSLQKNLHAFNQTIKRLQHMNVNIYDQIPMESHINRIRIMLGDSFNGLDILNHIYLPLFLSKKITNVHFMNNWESSQGAQWEHNLSKELGKKMVYLE